MADVNWQKVANNLMQRVSNLALEHAAALAQAQDLAHELDHANEEILRLREENAARNAAANTAASTEYVAPAHDHDALS